jgi:hypothetical protein
MLLTVASPLTGLSTAEASEPSDMQAQNIMAIFNAETESTTINWENIQTENGTLWQLLQSTRYLVYRHSEQMNASMVENGTVEYFANVSACPGALASCSGGQHIVENPLPPGVNGTFYYGIATQLDTGEIVAFLELGSAQTDMAIGEFTHDITAPFNVNATFDPATSKTLVQWINLNELQPGTLPESGPFQYQILVYRHLDPADRSSWPGIQKELIGQIGAGNTSFTYTVPPFTDVLAYYSVTYVYGNYEDVRFLGSNTLPLLWPVAEDNVPPGLVQGGVTASFVEEPVGGTGNTTVAWVDLLTELNPVYKVWRSGSQFNNTTNPDVLLIATVPPNVGFYEYQVERGMLGFAYYAVTVADARGNHNPFIGDEGLVLAGPIMEDAFNHWIAEPTNVQAFYLGGGLTNVSWVDQVGAEGESYHVWHSWTKLTAASNLTLEATLMVTVPDGVQQAFVPVPDDKDRLSYYCVTSVTRYNHLNATFENTGFSQNCIQLALREDTLAPAPVQLAQPMLQGSQRTVQLAWINSQAEEYESYSIYRHLGDPFGGNQGGNLSDDEGWELMVDMYTPSEADTTVLREVYLAANLDRETWYALTITDTWGNTRSTFTNRSNAWLVHEDTTPPGAGVTISIGTDPGLYDGALKAGDYRLNLFLDEPVYEHPWILVTTADYDSDLGTGHTFTPAGEVTRAAPFLGSTTWYYWDFPIHQGIPTGVLKVTANLIDMVGNSVTLNAENWSIDATNPTITVFSPSTDSSYLYGDDIRIHGVVHDDVGIAQVTFRFIENRGLFEDEFEWEVAVDVTPADAPPGTFVFDMREPSATFTEPANHKLEIKAIDTAGNEKIYQTRFYVDHCTENIYGLTDCLSGDGPIKEQEEDPAAPITWSDPPYVIIVAVVAFNVLLLFFAILMGIIAAQDPRKKKKGDDDEFDDEDDWMMEFMGGGSDDVATGVGGKTAMDEAPERDLSKAKTLDAADDEDDPFASPKVEKKQKKKKRSSKSRKKKVEEEPDDDDDFDDDDDDDDDWGDEDDKPKKKPKRKAVKRRAVKRKK